MDNEHRINTARFIRAIDEVRAIEESHGLANLEDLLRRAGVDESDAIVRAILVFARGMLAEAPELADKPEVLVSVGVAYGFAAGLKAQRALEAE